ncbi:MAG: hypothetical protein HY080_05045 [Gammaproteobacteria bacterium]|nr:hypothetical protein [Gammaproteobacteria bacterium]
MMDITLIISKSDSKTPCVFHAVGIQTDETIFCSTNANQNLIELKFKSFENGKVLNDHGVELYKVGSVLFSLEKAVGKDKKILYIPHWASYVPFDDMEEGGKYQFVKTK